MELLSEVWLKLPEEIYGQIRNRLHFYNLFAAKIQQILCDLARYKLAQFRGGGLEQVELREEEWITTEGADHWLTWDRADEYLSTVDALAVLAADWPREVRVFTLREIAGFEPSEIVEVLAETEGATLTRPEVTQAVRFIKTLVRRRLKSRSDRESNS